MFFFISTQAVDYLRSTVPSFHPSEQACDPAQKADVAAVVMQEGLANVVLVTPAMTLLRAKVEVTIPRKRKGSCTQHEKVTSFQVPNALCSFGSYYGLITVCCFIYLNVVPLLFRKLRQGLTVCFYKTIMLYLLYLIREYRIQMHTFIQ